MELRRICKRNYVVLLLVEAWIARILHRINLQYNRKQKKSIDTSLECGIIIITYDTALKEVSMDKRRAADPKEKALRDCGAFNTHPVADTLFKDNDFFDPRDLVQVKYEMLRKVHQDREPVSHAAASFGFSRPSFYKTSVDFEREGIAGLLPRKRGPRGGHKLTGEVLAFIEEMCAVEQSMGIPALLEELEKRFGIRVHRRSLERARRRCEKKTPPAPGSKERQPR
jgi:transposase